MRIAMGGASITPQLQSTTSPKYARASRTPSRRCSCAVRRCARPRKGSGDAAQRHRIGDELTRTLFFVGDFEIVSAPGAVAWEITTHRAPGKGEHDKSRADNLSHCRSPPQLSPPNVDTTDHLGRMFDKD